MKRFLSMLTAVVVLTSMFMLSSGATSTVASASKMIPTCSQHQLEVAVASIPGVAAGNIGIPFIIANISKSTCSMKGYPKLRFAPDSFKGHSLKVTNGGGMIFVSVKPRLVVLKPGADASFGLNYGDAANQQDPRGAACTAQNVYVTLPVRTQESLQTNDLFMNLNFCYTGFEVHVTSIQAGPLPK